MRSTEVTVNHEVDQPMYHHHMHVLLFMKSSYFTGTDNYISQAEWTGYWQRAMKLTYMPVVNVEAVILKNRNGATGDTLHYAYYSMFNKFLDMDDTENYSQQSKPESRTQVDDDGRVFGSNKEYREFLEG
ncbi:protein rep [Limosilactobacillus reuteri]|uniref:protein rep n=1 Tax=Limosilactobacillus reuteri TaxID=1598 RepID=UPI00298C6039|nr:protein rep [Limosilactobacillus reuteri]